MLNHQAHKRHKDACREARAAARGLARQLMVMLDLLRAGLEARMPGARRFVRSGLDAPAP